MEPKYVYLIKGGANLYKIGVTTNVDSRLISLQVSNSHKIHVITAKKIYDADKLEFELHNKFKSKRTAGGTEWFKFTNKEVIDICIDINLAKSPPVKTGLPNIEKIVRQFSEKNEHILGYLKEIKNKITIPLPIPKVTQTTIEKIKTERLKFNDKELLEKATSIVIADGRASSSLLQRKLNIGYARASRIMDFLESAGIVGPLYGSKPRLILKEKLPELSVENSTSSPKIEEIFVKSQNLNS